MDIYRFVRNIVLQWLEDNLSKLRAESEKLIPEITERVKASGYKVDNELLEYVKQIVEENARFIHSLIHRSAFKAGKILGLPENKVKETIEEIEKFVYPDGLNLSRRLFVRKREIEKAFKEVLFRNIKLSESAKKIAYEFQYAAENVTDEEFVNLLREDKKFPKLVRELERIARQVVKGEASREKWQAVIKQYERYIEERSRLGTYYSHKALLGNLTEAVENLSEEAIEDAVRWWAYNKQLYYFERIARTEVANTYHLAIIKQTEDDEFVIGYKWELSPSHEKADICDVYASVNFGLGKGVWPKKRVPRRKAHPHCTCLLIPVEGLQEEAEKKTKKKTLKELIRENPQGFEEWLKTRKWAWELYQKGVPLEEFFDEKHLRLKTQKEMEEWEKLVEIKPQFEEILGQIKQVPYKEGDTVRFSKYPKKEKVVSIVEDLWGYQFVITNFRVKHSLRIPKYRSKRKLKQLPYLQKAWKMANEAFKNPDAIAIYKEGEGLVYAKKVDDKYVLFAVDPKTRAIDTAFVKNSLQNTQNYRYIYKRKER
jgi:hypothetical protein